MQIHHHSQQQQAVLREMLAGTIASLLAIKFNEPEKDNLTIRQHAYFTGHKDLLEGLLADNYPSPELPQTETDQQQEPSNHLEE